MGAFSMRLVRARDVDEALHAGILPSEPARARGRPCAPGAPRRADRPGLRSPSTSAPGCCAPPARGATLSWPVANPLPCDEAAALVSNGSAPALIGPEMTPVRWATGQTLGRHRDAVQRRHPRRALHDVAGWPTPTITEIIPETAWTRIVRRDAHRMLALNPSDNVMRGLMRTSRRYPLSIAAHPWNPTCGLIWEDDTLTTIQLTVGSVNT